MSHKNFGAKAWLQPMPVGIIGTYDQNGRPNAMNAAWVGQWDMTQITISVSKHATTVNLLSNPDFTLALADRRNMVAADYVGIVSGNKVPDKVAKAGLNVERAEFVNAPVFTNFPITLECRLVQKIGEEEPGGGCNLIADILNVRCDEAYLDAAGNPDLDKIELICYDSIGNNYRVLGKVVGRAFHDGAALK